MSRGGGRKTKFEFERDSGNLKKKFMIQSENFQKIDNQ